MIAALLAAGLALAGVDQRAAMCHGEPVKGCHVSFAEGFSVRVPRVHRGLRPAQDRPQRGVSIALTPDCAAIIVVVGQTESTEGPSPRHHLDATVGGLTPYAAIRARRYAR